VSGRGPVVILGAAGFIGRALTARLATKHVPVRAITRREEIFPAGVEARAAGSLGPATRWEALLGDAAAVVHLASRAHAPKGDESWVGREVATARSLAHGARAAGVRRILFMSSIKAMGDATSFSPFRADEAPRPVDAYGRAKLAIEAALRAGPELVVLRPPLVYGPGVKGNFATLLRVVRRGLPLPFASVGNQRALIFLENLLDVTEAALEAGASPATYLMRDDEEPSTPDLVGRVAQHMDRAVRLFSCPPALLEHGLRLVGKADAARALLQSLRIDDGETRARLGWKPRTSLDEGLAATCRWFDGSAR
jgi:nucleoside-diphosphate-sugar epimerase